MLNNLIYAKESKQKNIGNSSYIERIITIGRNNKKVPKKGSYEIIDSTEIDKLGTIYWDFSKKAKQNLSIAINKRINKTINYSMNLVTIGADESNELIKIPTIEQIIHSFSNTSDKNNSLLESKKSSIYDYMYKINILPNASNYGFNIPPDKLCKMMEFESILSNITSYTNVTHLNMLNGLNFDHLINIQNSSIFNQNINLSIKPVVSLRHGGMPWDGSSLNIGGKPVPFIGILGPHNLWTDPAPAEGSAWNVFVADFKYIIMRLLLKMKDLKTIR